MARISRTNGALRSAALAVGLMAAALGPAWAQTAGSGEAESEALREYNAYAAGQAARAGVAMLRSGYTKYAITELEKAVRLAPKNAAYRKTLALARQRLAAETLARQRRAVPPASDDDPDGGIQVPGFEPPATVAGSHRDVPDPAGSATDATQGDTPGKPAPSGPDGSATSGDATKGASGATADRATAVRPDGPDGSLIGAGHYNVPLGVVPGAAPRAPPTSVRAIRPVERAAPELKRSEPPSDPDKAK
jgi:hypothetical protein